jgi:hypothetical protein
MHREAKNGPQILGDRISVDNALLCGVQNIGVVQDLADAHFPQSNGYEVSPTSGQFLFISIAIPVGVDIVDPSACWLGRRRAVVIGIGVSAVYAPHDESHRSRQSKERTHS